MNTKILKLARRHHDGSRSWAVPGYLNACKLHPAGLRTAVGNHGMFTWPCVDHAGDEMRRSVCLLRHRQMARRYARDLINESIAAYN